MFVYKILVLIDVLIILPVKNTYLPKFEGPPRISQPPSGVISLNFNALEYNNVTLSCFAEGKRPLRFSWHYFSKINDQIHSIKDNFIIHRVDSSDSSSILLSHRIFKPLLIYCSAENELGGIVSNSAKLVDIDLFRGNSHINLALSYYQGRISFIESWFFIDCFDDNTAVPRRVLNVPIPRFGDYTWYGKWPGMDDFMKLSDLDSGLMAVHGLLLIQEKDLMEFVDIEFKCEFVPDSNVYPNVPKSFLHKISTTINTVTEDTKLTDLNDNKNFVHIIYSCKLFDCFHIRKNSDNISLDKNENFEAFCLCIDRKGCEWIINNNVAEHNDLSVKITNFIPESVTTYLCQTKQNNFEQHYDFFNLLTKQKQRSENAEIVLVNSDSYRDLNCPIRNNATYFWYQNGNIVMNSIHSTLSLSTYNMRQQAVYQCFARRSANSVNNFTEENKTFLIFKYLLEFVSLSKTIWTNAYILDDNSVLNTFRVIVSPAYFAESLLCDLKPNPHEINVLMVDCDLQRGDAYFVMKYTNQGFSNHEVELICSISFHPATAISMKLQFKVCHQNCPEDGFSKSILKVISESDVNIPDAVQTLHHVTRSTENFTIQDIDLSVRAIDKIMSHNNISDVNVKKGMFQVFSNLLDVNLDEILEISSGTSDRYLQNLNTLVDIMSANQSVTITTKNLDLQSIKLPTDGLSLKGEYVLYEGDSRDFRIAHVDSNQLLDNNYKIAIALHKPSLIQENLATAFFFMRKSPYFQMFNPNKKIISSVISAKAKINSLNTSITNNLHAPVMIWFTHDEVSSPVICSFWDERRKVWAQDGCVTKTLNRTSSKCECSHLTSFALILDLHQDGTAGHITSKFHENVLSIVTYTGLTISLMFLLLTIIVYSSFLYRRPRTDLISIAGSVNQRTPIKIVFSFSCTLFIAHLMFLLSSNLSFQMSSPLCKLIACLMHYFYLSTFGWTVVQSAHLYVLFIHSLLSTSRLLWPIDRVYFKGCCVAWGVPLAIVIVTLSFNASDNYGHTVIVDSYRQYGICFLRVLPLYISFVAPVLAALVLNFVVFLLLIYSMFCSKRNIQRNNSKRNFSKRSLCGICGLVTLMSFSWTFGLIQLGSSKLIFQYLFVIGTTLQGVFIFFFYCIGRPDIFKHIKSNIFCFKTDKDRIGTLTSRSRTQTRNTDL